jgi:hypothetical protein
MATTDESRTPAHPPAPERATLGLERIVLHKPLLWLAIAMIALSIVAAIGFIFDPRETLGAPLWAKPLKFGLSITLYSLTLAWLIGMLKRHQRLAWWLGTISATFLAVEIVIIAGAAAIGTTSHFNVTTPVSTTLWSIMGTSIVVVWAAAILTAALLWRHRIPHPARALAIKSGLIIGIIGMGLAFLMTSPTAQQLSDFQGIAGAHTVGLPDGGVGLPLVGWSTEAGDLRIPHFVGMHALQLLPLSALLLELLARRARPLRSPLVRRRIVAVLVTLYAAITGVLTAQALMGQSIVRPDATVIAVTSVLFAAAASAIAIVVVTQRAKLTQ